MNNYSPKSHPLPTENGEASVWIEGYEVMREQCGRILC